MNISETKLEIKELEDAVNFLEFRNGNSLCLYRIFNDEVKETVKLSKEDSIGKIEQKFNEISKSMKSNPESKFVLEWE